METKHSLYYGDSLSVLRGTDANARSNEEVGEQGGRGADSMRAHRTLLGGTDMHYPVV